MVGPQKWREGKDWAEFDEEELEKEIDALRKNIVTHKLWVSDGLHGMKECQRLLAFKRKQLAWVVKSRSRAGECQREFQMLELALSGETIKDIAKAFSISPTRTSALVRRAIMAVIHQNKHVLSGHEKYIGFDRYIGREELLRLSKSLAILARWLRDSDERSEARVDE